jgi:hypothetical protein
MHRLAGIHTDLACRSLAVILQCCFTQLFIHDSPVSVKERLAPIIAQHIRYAGLDAVR